MSAVDEILSEIPVNQLARQLGAVEGGVDLDQVDTQDGAKIVKQVFGPNQGKVVDQINGFMGGAGAAAGQGNAITDLLGGQLGGGRR